MEEIYFLQQLFGKNIIEILKLFLSDANKQYYLKEISEKTNVSMATTYRTLHKLVKLGILKEIKISKFKIYQLQQGEKASFLGGFIKQSVKVLELFVSQIRDMKDVHMVIQHGKSTEDRANLLIIGEQVDVAKIKVITADLKEDYSFTLSYLTLTPEQYNQMSEMGLYSGQKKILFERT